MQTWHSHLPSRRSYGHETFSSICLQCKYSQSFSLMLWRGVLRKSCTWTRRQLRTKGQLRGEMVHQAESCGEVASSMSRCPGVPLLRTICDICASDATRESNFCSIAVMKCSSAANYRRSANIYKKTGPLIEVGSCWLKTSLEGEGPHQGDVQEPRESSSQEGFRD